jgi:hypothetical protein
MDDSGHLEDTVYAPEDTAGFAAELNAKASLLDCDSALEMQPGHVKAKFRKATALHRLGRVEEARVLAMSALHGAPTDEIENEVKALLETFDEEWAGPAGAAVDELSAGVEIMGKGLLASMAGSGGSGASSSNGGSDNDGGSGGGGGGGGLLASMASGVEEDARASFVSAAAADLDDRALGLTPAPASASVYGSERPGAADGAAAGLAALGADGDELYDLD